MYAWPRWRKPTRFIPQGMMQPTTGWVPESRVQLPTGAPAQHGSVRADVDTRSLGSPKGQSNTWLGIQLGSEKVTSQRVAIQLITRLLVSELPAADNASALLRTSRRASAILRQFDSRR